MAKQKQFNVRLEDTYQQAIERLIPAISAELGITVSASDVIRLGIKELQEKYLPAEKPKPKKGE